MTVPDKSGFWARNRWILAFATVVATGIILATAEAVDQSRHLAAQESQVRSLQASSSQDARQEAEVSEKTVLAGTGISAARVRKDTATLAQLLSMAFTWDSGETYELARESLKDRFGLSEKDAFLQTFLPPSRFNEDASRKRRYYIDAIAMTSAVSRNLDVDVVEVAATRYRYAVIADIEVGVSSAAQNGEGQPTRQPTATRRVLLYATVSADGTVSNLTGIAPSGSTRFSR